MNSQTIACAENEDEFSDRAESFLSAVNGVLYMYLPGADQKIEMLVGKNTKATISFQGTITQEAIMDVLAHLSFYKKYFPKDDTKSDARTPESIIGQFRAILAEDRAAREAAFVPASAVEDEANSEAIRS